MKKEQFLLLIVKTLFVQFRPVSAYSVFLHSRRARHEEEGSNHKPLVEEMLYGVTQHLVRNLSSQQDAQGLEAMALSMR